MSFWYRINQPKLKWKTLTRQFKRCYLQIPHAHSLNHTPHQTIRGFENPCWVNRRNPSDFCYNVRFFAAPVQAKPKQEEKDTSGPRMNDQIRAEFVRLVADDGHEIVSRIVALERARKLKLDLVEVQRKANPPVCKIMDFHKEKYKQQIKEKDRAKSKPELTLRKGDCKEVRFSGKTEAKDLKMKADMVKRLMDRGYRVKCMAMGTEDQDLGGLLTRLSDLIEDVCFVESGPRVEKRQAYVIVRHIKFGPSKKGSGKKASKVVGVTSSEAATVSPTISPTINPSSHVESPVQLEEESDTAESDLENEDEVLSDEEDTPISPSMRMPDITLDENKATWSVFSASDDFDKVFDLTEDANSSNSTEKQTIAKVETPSSPENINIFMHSPRPVLDSTRMNLVPSTPTEPRTGTLNRYGKSEPMNRFIPTSMDNKGPGATNSLRSEPQFLNQGKQARSDMNSSPSTGETKQDRTNASVFGNLNLPLNEIPKQEPSRPGPPSSQRPSYGAFSAPKAEAPGKLDPFASSARSEPQLPNEAKQSWSDLNVLPSTGGTKQVPVDASVSRNLKPPTNDVPKPEPPRPVPPSSPTSSYGIFSSPKAATAPGKQNLTSEVNRNKEGNPFESARNPSAGGVFNANSPSKSDGSQRAGVNQDGQGGWGIFSRDGSKVIPSRLSESEAKVQR